jgi:hypothetical protein
MMSAMHVQIHKAIIRKDVYEGTQIKLFLSKMCTVCVTVQHYQLKSLKGLKIYTNYKGSGFLNNILSLTL